MRILLIITATILISFLGYSLGWLVIYGIYYILPKMRLFVKNNIVSILILLCFVSLCVLAIWINYCHLNGCLWNKIFTIIYNLLGAFGALGLTYWLLKPKFAVCPTIARTLDNRIWICVKNNSLIAKLYSVKLELAYAYVTNETEYQDEIIDSIHLDCDTGITSLSPRIAKTDIEESNKFFVFHSERGFYPQWKRLKYIISATNTISNIVDIQEEYFDYENIKWGEFKKCQFISVKDLYTTEDQYKVNAIIKFISETCKILRPRKVKTKEVVKMLKDVSDFTKTFPDNYNTDFSCLIEISNIVDSFKKHITKLMDLYNASEVLPPTKLAYRNKLIMIINQELYTISSQMEKSLNKKK